MFIIAKTMIWCFKNYYKKVWNLRGKIRRDWITIKAHSRRRFIFYFHQLFLQSSLPSRHICIWRTVMVASISSRCTKGMGSKIWSFLTADSWLGCLVTWRNSLGLRRKWLWWNKWQLSVISSWRTWRRSPLSGAEKWEASYRLLYIMLLFPH